MVSAILTALYADNGAGVRASNTVDGVTTDHVLDTATTLPTVISDREVI